MLAGDAHRSTQAGDLGARNACRQAEQQITYPNSKSMLAGGIVPAQFDKSGMLRSLPLMYARFDDSAVICCCCKGKAQPPHLTSVVSLARSEGNKGSSAPTNSASLSASTLCWPNASRYDSGASAAGDRRQQLSRRATRVKAGIAGWTIYEEPGMGTRHRSVDRVM
jgi:hypothetical protein